MRVNIGTMSMPNGVKFQPGHAGGQTRDYDRWYARRYGERMALDRLVNDMVGKSLKEIHQMIKAAGKEPYEVILELMMESSSEYIRAKCAETAARYAYELPAEKRKIEQVNVKRLEIVFEGSPEALPSLPGNVIDVTPTLEPDSAAPAPAPRARRVRKAKPKNDSGTL